MSAIAAVALVAGLIACGRSAALACGRDEECPKGSYCAAYGHCVAPQATCATDRECGFSLRCFEFQCVDKRTCVSDLECLAGMRCVRSAPEQQTGLCAAPQTCIPGCPQGTRCTADFRCIEIDACGSDLDCLAQEHCVFGRCQSTHCIQNRDCDPDRVCTPSQTCLAQVPCVWDQQCPRDFSCQDSLCQLAALCPECLANELCVNGRCIDTTTMSTPIDPAFFQAPPEDRARQ